MLIKNIFKIVGFWLLLMTLCALLGETSVASETGETSADFLNIGVGGRATALSGAFTALASDVSSVYWNPAGLAYVNSTQFMFSHNSWYQDLNFEYFGVTHSAADRLSIGGSIAYLSYGDIEGYDASGNPTGEVGTTYNMAAGLSIGYQPVDDYAFGLTVKYISISLAGTDASALAVDLGARYSAEKFGAGLALTNLGQNIKFDTEDERLPTALKGGIYYCPFSSFMASADAEKQFYGDLAIKNGFEYRYDNYFLRTGYAYYPDQNNSSFGSGLSFGLGAIFGNFQIDYTYSPDSRVSANDIHRISLIIDIPR